jgi:hypothetical protein
MGIARKAGRPGFDLASETNVPLSLSLFPRLENKPAKIVIHLIPV